MTLKCCIFNLKAGAQGVCKTHYLINEDVKAQHIIVTKSKDLTNCQERIIKDLGLAYLETCPECQLVSDRGHLECSMVVN